MVPRDEIAHARFAIFLAGSVALLEDAVGNEREEIAFGELERDRRAHPLERHRREREAGRLELGEARVPRAEAEDRRLAAAMELDLVGLRVEQADECRDEAIGRQPLGELIVHMAVGGLEVGAEAKGHAQHRLHLRD